MPTSNSVGLVDGHLVHGRGVAALTSLPPSTIVDLVINWSRQAILTTLAEIAPREPELQQALPFIDSLLPAGYATASFSQAVSNSARSSTANQQGCNQSTVPYLIVCQLIGCRGDWGDGAAWYRAHRGLLLLIAGDRQSDGEAGEAFAHNMLAGFGIQGGIEGLSARSRETSLFR